MARKTNISTDEASEEKPTDTIEESTEEVVATSDYIPQGTYATAHFAEFGIPFCTYCGAAYQNSPEGAICPENFPTTVCPRLNNANSINPA